MNQLSIIIPILNEAKTINILLQHLIDNASTQNIAEIIVVDGGSSDGSQNIIKSFVTSSTSTKLRINAVEKSRKGLDYARPDIKILNTEKGRAKQMNKGATVATGGIFYFLHADSFPPKGFDTAIINEISQGNNAGCFRMKFNSKHPLLKISQWFTRFNFKICRGGDQSLFVTKVIFNELNGYNEAFSIYEDSDFTNKLYDRYNFTVIPNYITTSARRYSQNGTWNLQYHFTIIHLKKWFGASADELFGYYKKYIS